MTSELEKINGLLLELKWQTNDLIESFTDETITTRSAKISLASMATLITTSQTHLLCHLEDIKHHRRERRQQYRKNKKARKKKQSLIITELYKVKL